MSRRVHGADGRAWIIRRHWMSFRPRWRGSRADIGAAPWDIADIGNLGLMADDFVGVGTVVTGILIVVVVFVVSAVIALPLLLLLGEVVLFLLLGFGVLVANVVLRRPWIVEARTHDGRKWYRWAVVGFRRTERIMDSVTSALRSGIDLKLAVPPGQAKVIEVHEPEDRYSPGVTTRPPTPS